MRSQRGWVQSPSGLREKSIGYLGKVHRSFGTSPSGSLEKTMDQGVYLDELARMLDGLSFHGGAVVVSHITAVLIMCVIAVALWKAWGGYDAAYAKIWLGDVV